MGKRKPVHAKKAWAKIDTGDIERANRADSEALLRNADPQHKGNAELFYVDTKGTARTPGRRAPWELKSTSIIKANPKIPVIPNNSSFKKQRLEDKKTKRTIEQLAQQGAKKSVLKPISETKIRAQRAFDLWDSEEKPTVSVVDPKQQEWLSDQKLDPSTLLRATNDSKRSKKTLAGMKPEPSAHAAVEVPHPGAAYRPKEEDQQELMGKVAAKIVDEEQRAADRIRRLGGRIEVDRLRNTGMISKEDLPEYFNPQPDNDTANDADDTADRDSSAEEPSGAARPAAEKMTRAQRNKQARRRERDAAAAAAAAARRRDKDLGRVDELAKEVSRQVAARERAAAARAALREENRRAKAKRLGRHVAQPALPAVELPEESAPRLRKVRPDSRIVADRFRSLQLRNLMEGRAPSARRHKYSLLQARKIERIRASAYIE